LGFFPHRGNLIIITQSDSCIILVKHIRYQTYSCIIVLTDTLYRLISLSPLPLSYIMKFFNSSSSGDVLLMAVVASAVLAPSSDAFSMAPRGGIARNPFVSVARRVALSDPNTSTDIEAEESSSSSFEAEAAPVRHTVYVGNLPFTTTTDTVRQMFEGVAAVKSVSLPTNPDYLDKVTGMPMSKGFAFVDVEREEDVAKAIAELNEVEIEGRALRVNKMMPKEEVNRAAGNAPRRDNTPEGTRP
jgi:hypothetical protein